MTGMTLDPTDVDNVVRAVRVASKRGAFEMEESAQLIHSVQNLEAWLKEVVDARARVANEVAKNEPKSAVKKGKK